MRGVREVREVREVRGARAPKHEGRRRLPGVLEDLEILGVLEVLLVLLVLLVLAGCAPGPVTVTMPGGVARTRAVTLRVQVREGANLVVREVALEDYVAATALSEVHPDAGDERFARRVFEMQTVIARTYALSNRGRHARDGFDLCSTTHCQLYEPARLTTSRWAATVKEASARTAGEALWYGGAPAQALFHADCGGHTSGASAVWGGAAPAYLAGARDDGPAESAHVDWTFETTVSALRRALDADARTDVGAELARIDVAGRDAAGRAELITLRGTRTFVVRGEVFRDAVTRALGVKSIRSTLFTVKQTRGGFVFSGKGYGHGVGLCQAGAIARLHSGASIEQVLSFYFPGTSLRR
jgi:stage II sporulation protein D (peptidoglycan lytic transglycosylase)